MHNYRAQIHRLFGRPPLTADAIAQIVVNKSRVGMLDILSDCRRPTVTDPRHVAWWLCRKHLREPWRETAEYFSRDHSTVMHGVERIDRIKAVDERIETLITRCEREIRERWL